MGAANPRLDRVADAKTTERPPAVQATSWSLGPTSKHQDRRFTVATYLDIHDIPGVKAGDVIGAHEADVRVQGQYGVEYKHYWVDEEAGKVFCLVDAPDRETATRVHREAHGLEAHTLYEVKQGA
jgi:hypothetical protein